MRYGTRGALGSHDPTLGGAGYTLLEVKTLAEAVEWAKRAPFGVGMQDGEEWVVEIRPLFDPSDFDPPDERLSKA